MELVLGGDDKTHLLLSGKEFYFSCSPRVFYLIVSSADTSRFWTLAFLPECFASALMKVKYIWRSVSLWKKSYLNENEIFAGFVDKLLDWWKVLIAEAPTAKHMHPIWKIGFL